MDFSEYHQYMKDDKGRYRTQSLFWEYRLREDNQELKPVFTLKDRDHEGCISLKKVYMSYDHLPGHEYEFAIDVFNSWDQWVRITENTLLNNVIQKWKDEYEIKLRAAAIKALIKNATEDGAKGSASAKYIAEAGWIGKRGRPSKEEINRELKLQASLAKDFDTDIERIGLSVISGGRR